MCRKVEFSTMPLELALMRNRPELSDLFDAIQGERGGCECNKYFNIVENDAIFGMSASCYE